MGLGFLANPCHQFEGGVAPPSLLLLPPASPSSILAQRFFWSRGGGAAIYKGEWVGGTGLADTEAKENSQEKLEEPIFQQIIFLSLSVYDLLGRL